MRGTDLQTRSIGLGLFIVHSIGRAHGGRVDVRSSEHGTTFASRLPVTRHRRAYVASSPPSTPDARWWEVGALPHVQADAALLRFALKNLLSNAIKYTRPRAPAVRLVDAEVSADETHVWVRDNDVGFDMRYVDKLFGVFQRLHTADQVEARASGSRTCAASSVAMADACRPRGRSSSASFHVPLPRTAGRSGTAAQS